MDTKRHKKRQELLPVRVRAGGGCGIGGRAPPVAEKGNHAEGTFAASGDAGVRVREPYA